MKYGIIKVKRAFLYEENGVDVVDEVFFGWSVMWEDEGEWIEVWTHYGYRGWMERNLIEEKSREWMEGREKAGNTYVVTRGFADVMRGARVQARMLETLGRGCFVEKMEETENGYCRVKLANGISGFVPEVVANISGFVYAMIALGLNQSGFMAEIIRSALQSVDPGQIEAAHALGMTYPQTLRRIILPEAFEVALPTLGNSFISIIKGTSLAFTCAVVEITAQGQIIGGRTYRYFEVYVSLAIIYWLVTLVIEQIIRVIENKIRIPDQVELASANGEGKKNDKN